MASWHPWQDDPPGSGPELRLLRLVFFCLRFGRFLNIRQRRFGWVGYLPRWNSLRCFHQMYFLIIKKNVRFESVENLGFRYPSQKEALSGFLNGETIE